MATNAKLTRAEFKRIEDRALIHAPDLHRPGTGCSDCDLNHLVAYARAADEALREIEKAVADEMWGRISRIARAARLEDK